MKNKILLLENENVANAHIDSVKTHYSNWLQLESLLVKMGLDPESIGSLAQFNESLEGKFQFPQANREFNLEALGLTALCDQVTKIFKANYWSKEEPTAESIEKIREKHRVYTKSDIQIEAVELAQRMFNDVARAKELGLISDYHLFSFSENCSVYGYRVKNDVLGNRVMKIE